MRDERVLAALGLRVLRERPAPHEVAVRLDARELAGNGAVDGLGDVPVRGEEDIEVTLMNLLFVSCRLDGW